MNSYKRSNDDNEDGKLPSKKKRNTAEKIAESYGLDLDKTHDFLKSSQMKRQIGEFRWKQGNLILDEEQKKKNGKKHLIVCIHYNWDKDVTFPNTSLLSMWVFAIISVYNKEANKFIRKNVTVHVGKEFTIKYYNHEKATNYETVFDENDLINFIIQNPSMW